MATLKVGLVSPEREVWAGEAKLVVAQTIEGQLGILPGHAPVLGVLLDGSVVTIEPADGSEKIRAMVGSGFFSIAGDEVSVLAEQAELAHEIDVADARRALEEALSAGDADTTAERRARARLLAAGADA
ncbi:F0F1 ATP synthase subunit epsilon [Actinomadura rayongensis]|uniref:ATP synthase epsilon chain n=1 Tax=Actinomadura rayongensis TaxID=1429076 RepID=A0A6I4W289_9ACTN|nr:F0F1 ATP synthase subunit epsilon [Actinomadura rayongensis]